MCQVSVSLHNALFFLHGENKEEIIIPYIDGNEKLPIKSENCIVVFTQHAIDGNVSINIDSFKEKPKNLVEVFNSYLKLDNNILLATDPDGKELFKYKAPDQYKSISIWVDDVDFPAEVKILFILKNNSKIEDEKDKDIE